MKEMTDEEANALDEYYTRHPARVDPQKNGGFAKRTFRLVAVDGLAEDYLLTRAKAERKTPGEIITSLVREQIARDTIAATA